MVSMMTIGDRRIGCDQACYVIAEAGVNHNGDLGLAVRLVEAAVDAGADAVKFQTFRADQIVTEDAPKATYQQETSGETETHRQMLRRLELSADAHRRLIDVCRHRGIQFLSSPFDEESADLLDALEVPAFKISSGELTNLPFLSHVARKQKPIILSTGMATLEEVGAAVETVRNEGARSLALLHCVSCYPADPADVNLRAMATMRTAFGIPIGYSDHTHGLEVALAAVALGACILEKHLTLDRSLPGPDHRASTEPQEFTRLVGGIRTIQSALGTGEKRPAAGEAAIAAVARKSLVAVQDIRAGTSITAEMIGVKRPGSGLPPASRAQVIGRRAACDIKAGVVLREDLLL